MKNKKRKYNKTECGDVGCVFIRKNHCTCADVVDLCPLDHIGDIDSKEYAEKLKQHYDVDKLFREAEIR